MNDRPLQLVTSPDADAYLGMIEREHGQHVRERLRRWCRTLPDIDVEGLWSGLLMWVWRRLEDGTWFYPDDLRGVLTGATYKRLRKYLDTRGVNRRGSVWDSMERIEHLQEVARRRGRDFEVEDLRSRLEQSPDGLGEIAEKMLSVLSQRRRDAVVAWAVQGMTPDQWAETSGLTRRQAQSDIYFGSRRLREFYVTPEAATSAPLRKRRYFNADPVMAASA